MTGSTSGPQGGRETGRPRGAEPVPSICSGEFLSGLVACQRAQPLPMRKPLNPQWLLWSEGSMLCSAYKLFLGAITASREDAGCCWTQKSSPCPIRPREREADLQQWVLPHIPVWPTQVRALSSPTEEAVTQAFSPLSSPPLGALVQPRALLSSLGCPVTWGS